MTSPYSRRDMLKGTAAIAAAAAVGPAAPPRRAHAQAGRGARIDGLLKQAVDAKEVPGVVAMAATDRGALYEGAFGLRALDGTAAMTPDTGLRIASMTKAISTVAAMQLVEQGKLTLEGPVPNIDPTLGTPTVLGGIFNTYYWLDPAKKVTGLIMTQILPFADGKAVKLYGQLESGVYEAMKSA